MENIIFKKPEIIPEEIAKNQFKLTAKLDNQIVHLKLAEARQQLDEKVVPPQKKEKKGRPQLPYHEKSELCGHAIQYLTTGTESEVLKVIFDENKSLRIADNHDRCIETSYKDFGTK